MRRETEHSSTTKLVTPSPDLLPSSHPCNENECLSVFVETSAEKAQEVIQSLFLANVLLQKLTMTSHLGVLAPDNKLSVIFKKTPLSEHDLALCVYA